MGNRSGSRKLEIRKHSSSKADSRNSRGQKTFESVPRSQILTVSLCPLLVRRVVVPFVFDNTFKTIDNQPELVLKRVGATSSVHPGIEKLGSWHGGYLPMLDGLFLKTGDNSFLCVTLEGRTDVSEKQDFT